MRDLEADMAICEAATPGPWIVDKNLANQVRQPSGSNRRRITAPPDADGLADTAFIAAARVGWPHAIQRALAAEEKIKALQFALSMSVKGPSNDS